jgi:hypothetical protein
MGVAAGTSAGAGVTAGLGAGIGVTAGLARGVGAGACVTVTSEAGITIGAEVAED